MKERTSWSNEGWVQVRLRAATHARLNAFRLRLERRGPDDVARTDENGHSIGFSLDECVAMLLDRDDGHHARSVKAQAKRKERKQCSTPLQT